jgi:hypothetical protein
LVVLVVAAIETRQQLLSRYARLLVKDRLEPYANLFVEVLVVVGAEPVWVQLRSSPLSRLALIEFCFAGA